MDFENNKEELKWYLITIDDPFYLSKTSVKNLLNFILEFVCFNYVVVDDIQGSGEDWVISNMQKKQGSIFNKNEFFKFIDALKQLDWGDFFLYKEYPANLSTNKKGDYPYLISQTDTTLRLVDSQYFYIYTQSNVLINELRKKYKIESVVHNFLTHLDYPF